VIPGEWRTLLQRCRAEEAAAWAEFAGRVEQSGRVILGAIRGLSPSDREDVVADALRSLVAVVRCNEISGQTNGEIGNYVCATLRNRALNALRRDTRRREAGEVAAEPGLAHTQGDSVRREVADTTPPPDAQAIVSEQLDRAEKLLLSWSATDRYIFLAKFNGVTARTIQETLERPPFGVFIAAATIDTRFHRLRERLMRHILEP
jgi:DNA-directed RNA polymerase specialized sigma24 family protein